MRPLILLVITVCLSGCGQKGPLFKPDALERPEQEKKQEQEQREPSS